MQFGTRSGPTNVCPDLDANPWKNVFKKLILTNVSRRQQKHEKLTSMHRINIKIKVPYREPPEILIWWLLVILNMAS